MTDSPKKFDVKINKDTATPEKIKDTDEKLVKYMSNKGEGLAAKYIQDLIDKPHNNKEDTGAVDNFKLLTVDKEILKTLQRIQRDMIDEQDTSIKSVQKQTSTSPELREPTKTSDSSGYSGYSDDSNFFNPRKLLGTPDKKDKKTKKAPPKRTPKRGIKSVGKSALKTIGGTGGKLLRLARFAGPIGLVIGAGLAIKDGIDGFNNASDELGVKNPTLTNKMSSALGGVVSGLTFGLADSKNASKGINNLLGTNKVIDKYESKGIIDHDTIGNSDIEDWVKLSKLKPSEIQEIIDIDDWSNEDLARMRIIKTGKESAETMSKDVIKKDEHQEVDKVSYKIKTVHGTTGSNGTTGFNSSLNPDDYKPSELFKLNKVSEESMSKLDPNVLSNLKAMGAEYIDETGEKIQINSAFRSLEEQKKLKEQLGNKAATPGKSMHGFGFAVDINTDNANTAENLGLMKKYRFTRPVHGETWHVEPKGIDRAAIRGEKSHKPVQIATQTTQTTPVTNAEKQETGETKEDKAKDPVIADVSKTQREIQSETISNNLTETVKIEKQQTASDISSVIAPIIQPNINTVNESSQRPIHGFS